jgi:hypothetical protein
MSAVGCGPAAGHGWIGDQNGWNLTTGKHRYGLSSWRAAIPCSFGTDDSVAVPTLRSFAKQALQRECGQWSIAKTGIQLPATSDGR